MAKRILFNKILILSLSLLISTSAFSQIIDYQDTIPVTDEQIATEINHSPHKATIYSLCLPGLGQAYNKKYWKIPLIYIGFGTMGYFFDWNNGHYKTMKTAYHDLIDDDETTTSYEDINGYEYYDLTNSTSYSNFESALEDQRDYYRRNRDLLLFCLVGFYGLQIIDANVDAHLFGFDISEDLTFDWEPQIDCGSKFTTYGVCCTFTF